jgi:Arc/MetJ-type ribon-helix-helix transcriptional regulator
MNLALSPHVEKLITDHVKSGRFGSPEEVITAAISSLDQATAFGDFAPGELNDLLAEGDRDIENGDVLSGEEVFASLRRRSADQRKTGKYH